MESRWIRREGFPRAEGMAEGALVDVGGISSPLEYHLLRARDLKLTKPKDHEELAQHAIELNAC